MAASVETPSPISTMGSPLFSPSSDKRFWSSLRGRVDSLLETRTSQFQNGHSSPAQIGAGKSDRADQLKEDSLLLLRGFDSVSHTLSQLSNNLDNALQGARDLARPPTLTDIFHSRLKENADREEEESSEIRDSEELSKRGSKRKYDPKECSDDEDAQKKTGQNPKMNKAKNLALSMASNAASFARALKSMKSDLCFMQERCTLLEEENRRLRDGFSEGFRPEEDDLLRLQLEALLAEKSRLANENANLTRENQCLHQLVEYHQITSQDLSASYEQVIQGMCLDFSSPELAIAEEAENDESSGADDSEAPATPRNILNFPSLEE